MDTPCVTRKPQVLPRCVARVVHAMRMGPGRAFDLRGLARIGAVSPRTLQRRFQQSLGKRPLAVLRDIRHESARRELLRGGADATVTEIAVRNGFTHLGRFSLEYARRYGEKPSQTLLRQSLFAGEAVTKCNVFVPMSDRPSIAIELVGASDRNKDIAETFAEELAVELMRHGVAITEKSNPDHYRLQIVSRDGKADFRLIFKLVELKSMRLVWAHHHDAETGGGYLDQRVAMTVAAAMQSSLRAAEIQRARRIAVTDATAHDLTIRALPHALAISAERNRRALDLLERALARDPDYQLALALASWCHAQCTVYHFAADSKDHHLQAVHLARRVAGTSNQASVLAILGNAFAILGQLDNAQLVTRKALNVCGSSSWAWARSGLIDVCNARAEPGIEQLLIALELAPDDPLKFNYSVGIGAACFELGRFAQAAHWFERGLLENSSAIWIHELLCPSYANSGRKDDARNSLAAFLHRHQDMTISGVNAGLHFFTQSFRDEIANGLETAGMRV